MLRKILLLTIVFLLQNPKIIFNKKIMSEIWFNVVFYTWDDKPHYEAVPGLVNKIWGEGNFICLNVFDKGVVKVDKDEYKEFKARWD